LERNIKYFLKTYADNFYNQVKYKYNEYSGDKNFIYQEDKIYEKPICDIIEDFKNNTNFHIKNDYIDEYFDISWIDNIEFNKKTGLQLYKLNNNNYILFYIFEKINDNIDVLENFFDTKFIQTNDNDNNKIYDIFQKIKKEIIYDTSYINYYLYSFQMKIFYDESFINEIYEKSKIKMVMCDFIEIGTSDFNTCIQDANEDTYGLSIEPIKYYLDKLPNKNKCLKINCAISDDNGYCDIYFIPEEKIINHNLLIDFKGCNSINNYHPSVERILREKNLNPENFYEKKRIPKKTMINIIEEYNVEFIYYLKIDTEGHDTKILEKFISDQSTNSQLPQTILFESNVLSNKNEVTDVIKKLNYIGYDLVYAKHDTFLKLNLTKIKNKHKFSKKIQNYYIPNYPPNYNCNNLPHNNNLESAMEYCKNNNHTGIVYQNNLYTVRCGEYILYSKDKNPAVYIYL
jgi:hypothetical protein